MTQAIVISIKVVFEDNAKPTPEFTADMAAQRVWDLDWVRSADIVEIKAAE